MTRSQRESLQHLLAVVREDPMLHRDVQTLLPLLEPRRRRFVAIPAREDQTHIPL
jgi:hypothetical protein